MIDRLRSSVLLRNIRERIKGGVSRASRVDSGPLYLIRDGDKELFISRLSRLGMYRNGIAQRVNALVDSYRLSGVMGPGDLFFDVGANIGELGLWVSSQGGRYVGLEPEKTEFKALGCNVKDGVLFNVGAWRSSGQLQLFSKAETADSSLIQIAQYDEVLEIEVRSIDDIVKTEKIPKIKVLKIETEGAEPEVLEGAESSLTITEFVALDCGEERGVNKRSTFLECHQFLTANGFHPFRENLRQYRLLYKNSRCL